MTPTAKTIVQKIKVNEKDALGTAQRYYSLLSAISNRHLTEREIQLVAFTAVKGNISYSTNRKEFCEKYGSSSPTINNIISKLKKMGLLVKDADKIKVNPQFLLDFNNNVTLQINVVHG